MEGVTVLPVAMQHTFPSRACMLENTFLLQLTPVSLVRAPLPSDLADAAH